MWFHLLPDSRALLSSKGVCGPNRRLYAQWGSGFIRLGCQGVSLVSLDLPFTPELEKPLPEGFINGQK